MPPSPPLSMEKLYFTKLVPGAKSLGTSGLHSSSLHTGCFFLPVYTYWVTKVLGDILGEPEPDLR